MELEQRPLFDPNAFGVASLLGGLFVLGISADLMRDREGDSLALTLAYLGLVLLAASAVAFLYSCLTCLMHRDERRPLLAKAG